MISARVLGLLVPIVIQSAPLGAQKDGERALVIKVVLDSVFRSQGDRAPIILVFDSLYHREFDPTYDDKLSRVADPSIDPETIADFYAKSDHNVPFPKGVDDRRLKLLSMTNIDRMHEEGRSIEVSSASGELRDAGFWYAFAKRYTNAWGITFLSDVGFNKNRSQALIFVRHQCGGGCGNQEVIFLVRKGSSWRIDKRVSLWAAENSVVGSLRSIASDAHAIADTKFEERERADSVRRDAVPRRVRGRVVSRQTGLPVPGMQIVLIRFSAGIDSSGSVATDARGRYTIENPRVGGMLMLVRCPVRKVPRQDLMGANVLVRPQLDTIVDILIDNIAPCWERPIHPLESGELASSDYQRSAAPSTEEVKIYSAVLDDTSIVHTDREKIFVDALTWAECEEECSYASLRHLVPGKSEDSTAVSHFRGRLAERSRLNPARMSALHVRLLPWAERVYLTEEGSRLRGPANDPPRPGFWLALKAAHPDIDAVLSFTHVGFDSDGTHALVGLRIQTSEDALMDETVLLEEAANTWRVSKRHLEIH